MGSSTGAAPQTDGEQQGITRIRDLIAAGRLEIRAYLKKRLHAKACIPTQSTPKGTIIA